MKHRIVGPAILLLLVATTPADDARKVETYQVPYRLTEVQHILVRAKINGKGPFHFIVDTGAPALFVSTAAAKKVGVTPDADGWGTFPRFELEGGVVLEKIQGQIADPYQLDGMNQLGLAGVELHGVLGFNLLARFKLEIDLTRDHMTWTRLPGFEPEMPRRMGKSPPELNAMGGLVKTAAALMGKRSPPEIRLGGYLGVELSEQNGVIRIDNVLADSPAALAGLKKGDRLSKLQDQELKTLADAERQLAKLAAGDAVSLLVIREGREIPVSARLGKGF